MNPPTTPEPVEIVPYDPEWPARFEQERSALLAAAGDQLGAVEHIGSTSIPGLAAKPVIDILAAVDDPAILDTAAEDLPRPGDPTPVRPAGPEPHRRLVEALTGTGLRYNGVNGLPGRLYFHRSSGIGGVHIHVVAADSWFRRDQLLFRDWLREHPRDVAVYTAVKRELASRYRNDRVAYTSAKTPFIRDVLRRAGGQGSWVWQPDR